MPNSPNLPLDDKNDAELASLVARRDSALAVSAFQALHARYAPRLISILSTRMGPELLERGSREVWRDLWEALGDPERFDGQDFSTLALKAVHEYRDDPAARALAARLEAKREALGKGLASLHAGERAVVEFRLGGLTFEEIATRAKSTAERAEMVFGAARKKLNASLEPQQP